MIRGVQMSITAPLSRNVVTRNFSEQVRKSFKKMANRPAVQEQRNRNAALEEKAAKSNLEWRVIGATYVMLNSTTYYYCFLCSSHHLPLLIVLPTIVFFIVIHLSPKMQNRGKLHFGKYKIKSLIREEK